MHKENISFFQYDSLLKGNSTESLVSYPINNSFNFTEEPSNMNNSLIPMLNQDYFVIDNNQNKNGTEDSSSLAKVALHQIEILKTILEKRYQLQNKNNDQKTSKGSLYESYINNLTLFAERVPISSLPPSLRLDMNTKMELYRRIVESYDQKRMLNEQGFPIQEEICSFCKNNNEPEFIYRSHRLKVQGQTSCPLLRLYKCPVCNATGDFAHTLKYCPENIALRAQPLLQQKF